MLSLLLSYSMAYAEPEYDIVLLAPAGQALKTHAERNTPPKINNNGDIIGIITNGESDPSDWCRESYSPYVFRPSTGFKLFDEIKFPSICAQFNITVDSIRIVQFCSNESKYDIYDLNHNSMHNISALDIKNADTMGILEPFIYSTHAANGKVFLYQFFYGNKDWHPDETLIYDYHQKTISVHSRGIVKGINTQGQMIGLDRNGDRKDGVAGSWFFDPMAGYLGLGSLDPYNRLPVKPVILTESGYVAGTGYDSQHNIKGFLWSLQSGLIQISSPKDCEDEPVSIIAANEKGDVLGNLEFVVETAKGNTIEPMAFIYNKDTGKTVLIGESAMDINDQKQVVGSWGVGSWNTKAFIWDAVHGMRDLTKLIPPNTGWKKLLVASSINNDGYIVGVGIYYGVEHTFLLIPKHAKK